MSTVQEVIAKLPRPNVQRLQAPPFSPGKVGPRVGLVVESMKRHMTNEGYEIFAGLEHAGYRLQGFGLPVPDDRTDVSTILKELNPSVVFVQDKLEWDPCPGNFREPRARFTNVGALKADPNIFKVTIRKDSHSRVEYNLESAEEMGCHGWVVYYHPAIVTHLCPFLRPEHVIRTYHTVDSAIVPEFNTYRRERCMLSGAVGGAYPVREFLVSHRRDLRGVDYFPHPGYHRNGCQTPAFLKQLSSYRVAICTCSIYGYALRKIIEATACGCIVLTNLPSDEVLPEIDGNLVRLPDQEWWDPRKVNNVVASLHAGYNPKAQAAWAEKAKGYYDYRQEGRRLSDKIDALRARYNGA